MADMNEIMAISRANYDALLDDDEAWANSRIKAIKSKDPTAYWDFKPKRHKV